MSKFSERKGYKPVRTMLQIESMDNVLRNSLWNALTIFYWSDIGTDYRSSHPKTYKLCARFYVDYFKKPMDQIKLYWPHELNKHKEYFFACAWNEAYDFIEFVANTYDNQARNDGFMKYCNEILERELSSYRFVDGQIVEMTSKEEIEEIEQAANIPLKPVTDHLQQALTHLANKKSPDYRNSIKESISAVEALCKLISGDPKATLSQALKSLEAKVALHSALKKSFDSLYGYTSDAAGIRHALLDDSNLDFEDAKFMLVSCSAFVNYLVSKAAKEGIKLGRDVER